MGKHKNVDKPWEDDSVDHWKQESFAKEDMAHHLTEESSFAVLFPSYREAYLREAWPAVTSTLKEHGIACQLDLIEGSMTVSTTRKTWDPYSIVKARDMVKLLARSVTLQQASRILDDEVACDIIKIGGLCRSKERFIKRRDRLLGPNGSTLKAIELLTDCYVLVQGNTVSCMGPHKGLKQVRKLVEDCMRNFHPVYHIKALMIRRELEKDPALAAEPWDRFLPSFKKKNAPRPKKRHALAGQAAKPRTPFPPAPTPRKVDLQLESGEYFLSADQRSARRLAEKRAQQAEGAASSSAKRQERYQAPKEAKPAAARPAVPFPPAEPSAADLAASLKAHGAAGRKRPAPPDTAARDAAAAARAAELKRLLPDSKKDPKGLKAKGGKKRPRTG